MKTKIVKRVGLCLLGLSLLFTSVPASAQSLSEAEKKKAEISNSLKEANKLVNSLKDSKKSTEDKIASLDAEIASIETKNQIVIKEIDEANKEIFDLNRAIEDTKSDLMKKQQDMAIRIVYTYENGRSNMLNALFSAKSYGEFLNILQYTIELANFDREVMEEYEQTLQILSEQTDALAEKQEDAERLASENENQMQAVSALKAAREGELTGIEGELTDAVQVAEVYEKEMKAQNEVLSAIKAAIAAEKRKAQEAAAAAAAEAKRKAEAEAAEKARQEAEKAKQEAMSQQNGEASTAPAPVTPTPAPAPAPTPEPEVTIQASQTTTGFTWPCPSSKRITSDFGMRESPTAGASTNHKGIDIGAPKGSSIVAAQAGTVILSQYSASAGNYIIVSHGVNSAGKLVCTVYMHADTRLVSVGQTVKKGQQIATVGSTGYSTGPHLHFGVTEDGTYVSPWKYVSK